MVGFICQKMWKLNRRFLKRHIAQPMLCILVVPRCIGCYGISIMARYEEGNSYILEYITRCLICQQVKSKRQKPIGLLNPLPIPEWKWEHVMMDFLFGLPRTPTSVDRVR